MFQIDFTTLAVQELPIDSRVAADSLNEATKDIGDYITRRLHNALTGIKPHPEIWRAYWIPGLSTGERIRLGEDFCMAMLVKKREYPQYANQINESARQTYTQYWRGYAPEELIDRWINTLSQH